MTNASDLSALAGIATELEQYVAACKEARTYGGPTLLPTNPLSEDWAQKTATLIRTTMDQVNHPRTAAGSTDPNFYA